MFQMTKLYLDISKISTKTNYGFIYQYGRFWPWLRLLPLIIKVAALFMILCVSCTHSWGFTILKINLVVCIYSSTLYFYFICNVDEVCMKCRRNKDDRSQRELTFACTKLPYQLCCFICISFSHAHIYMLNYARFVCI